MPAGPRGRETPPRACEVWREQVNPGPSWAGPSALAFTRWFAGHSKGFVDSVLAGFRGPHRDCEPRLVAGTVEGTPGTLRSVASLFANE